MSTAMEVKKVTPIQELRVTMESPEMREQIKKALPPHINVDKFIRVAVTAASNNPKLVEHKSSFYKACMQAAADGLVPDNKEAAMVIFGDSVAYMPMIAGILKKVRNSGELASITAQIVHKNDKFKYWIDGDGEHIEHEPLMFLDRGDKIGVYALAKTKDDAVYIEVLTSEQVAAIKNVSRQKNGPWSGAFSDEMWKKSAIRRLSKRLPMSTDLEQVIQRDDEMYDLDKQPEQAPQEEKQPETKSSRLSKIVAAQTEKTPVVEAAEIVEPNEDPNVDDLPI